MPAQPICYPSAKPVAFWLDAEAVRAAAAVLSKAADKPELAAFDAARLHLTSSACLALDAGRLLITSAHRPERYTCTRTSCTCKAGQFNRQCWHKAAATVVRWIWDRSKPLVRCPHCYGPMVATRTIGGERSVSCLVCSHELLFGAIEQLQLATWYEPAAQRAA